MSVQEIAAMDFSSDAYLRREADKTISGTSV